MKNNPAAVAAMVIGMVAAGAADSAIVSVTTGAAVRGDRASNLLTNGSFELRASGDPGPAIPVYWSGVDGLHTESTLQALVYTIPGWSQTSGVGAYGIWGDSALLKTDPCAHGVACVYFGNWVTQPSPFPTFNSDGTATFASAPTFTNQDPDNQTPTTLYQTVGLTKNATYLLDFWASSEHYAAPFPDPSVFRLGIGSNDSVFLTTPSVNSVFNANSQRYFVEFTADNTSETISFTNFGHIVGNTSIPTATELILDDAILNRVPEPATLALVAIGLLGLFARRSRTVAAPTGSATMRSRRPLNWWVCTACAAAAFTSAGAAATPIVLPFGPLYFEFRTAEQYSPGNAINQSANPAGVGSKPEGNWGIVQITTISIGTLVSPIGLDIAGPGATVFSDGQNNGQQILGIFYAVLNNSGQSPSTSTGGVLDLYFWDNSSQTIKAPLNPMDLGKRGKDGSQSGNSLASAPSEYQNFTCLPNTVNCAFLARFDFMPGADVRTGFNTNTIFTAANSTVSETYMAVDTGTPGAWSDTLDSDFFTFNPVKQPCGPGVACTSANDARLDAPFIPAPDWDIGGSDIVGLAKTGSLRVFSTPEPATLALLAISLVVAGASRTGRRAARKVNDA